MKAFINKPAGNSVYDEIAGFQVKECLFSLSLFTVAENTLLLFPQLRIHAKRYRNSQEKYRIKRLRNHFTILLKI